MSGLEAQGSEPGLESHLRNLILSSGTLGQREPASHSGRAAPRSLAGQPPLQGPLPITPVASANVTHGPRTAAGSSSPVDVSSNYGTKAGRKRPNQAQRRQMNSEFSIPIDPHSQHLPPSAPNLSPSSGYHARPSQQHQRHMHSNSYPRAIPYNNRSQGPYQGHWNGPPQHSGPYQPGRPPISPHHQRNSSQFFEPESPQAGHAGSGYLYNHRRHHQFSPEEIIAQSSLLDKICFQVVSNSEIEISEIAEKEAFRRRIEAISRETILEYEQQQGHSQQFPPLSVELKCFGSLSSGFATKASDMDLGLLSPLSQPQPESPDSPIPRLLEKALLDAGLGARLLTRTRVPIIKLCEKPPKQLFEDLLAERQKWDNGSVSETHDAHEDDHDHHVAANTHENEHVEMPNDGTSLKENEFIVPSRETGLLRRFHIKQASTSGLSTYYALAKRVLRRAGGRDVTMSNYREFDERDWNILNEVCKAYIRGLENEHLRQRLEGYPSLAFEPAHSLPNNRSLAGVATQVEGEWIIMAWEKVSHITDRNPSQVMQLVNTWKDIQQRRDFGVDPILYTKELQLTLDKIKKIPSIQLLCLEQGERETPQAYFGRVAAIINQLRPDSSDPLPEMREIVLQHYVSGIYRKAVREAVEEALSTSSIPSHLKAVSLRHASLHLACDLEKALEKDLYDEAQAQDIKDYIEVLRSPLRRASSGRCSDFVVPLARRNSDLVDRIKSLPEPQRILQPKVRDRYRDRLEFPKTGTGVQCDINFSAHLALQNTLLLRCYSHTDPRVRPMVLFVKHWAKVRGINSGYRGTLSSYGYVLMVLHYLINVAQPFVCPNLQQLAPPIPPNLPPAEFENTILCKGRNVQFWRNEGEISRLALANQLNHNTDTIGQLLRGFFEYYAHSNMLSTATGKGYDWGRDVISLRTAGGLLSKQEKGWTGAKSVFEAIGGGANAHTQTEQTPTEQPHAENGTPNNESQSKPNLGPNKNSDIKEIRHRYLFAIEDPFELDHNVARTVTHNGIVSIRDEFRRAWRIIKSAGTGGTQEDLLQDVVEENAIPFWKLLDEIHGPDLFEDNEGSAPLSAAE